MSGEHQIEITMPGDSFTPGKTYGDSQASVRIVAPYSMTPDRFREIVKAKGGRMGTACWQLSPLYGPVLEGQWTESGVKVVLTGVVDVEAGRRMREPVAA